MKTKFNTSSLEEFPGKHWFSSLSAEQLFARRIGLERYLHSICQDRTIGTSDVVKEFFIAIQKVSNTFSASSKFAPVLMEIIVFREYIGKYFPMSADGIPQDSTWGRGWFALL